MKKTIWASLVVGFVVCGPLASAAELFQYNGKKYTETDLEPKFQSKLFETEAELHKIKERLFEDAVLDIYLAERAAKEKTTVDQLREKLLKVSDPSEKELKKFFEENKSRIPYPYEQVKGELTRFVKEQKVAEARKKLADEAKKKGGFVMLLKEPESPRVAINTDGFATRGKVDAKVTVVEFADYKCGHCREASQAFKELYKKYDNKVKFVYIDFPIISGSDALAEGAHCAAKQDKYWEYNKAAFEEQGKIKTPVEVATKIDLDKGKFDTCMKEGAMKALVEKGKKEGERIGISGTPAIFINGRRAVGGHTVSVLTQEIEKELR